MKISTSCPSCGARYALDERFASKRVKCQKCQQPFSVPTAEPAPPDDLYGLADAEPEGARAPDEELAPPIARKKSTLRKKPISPGLITLAVGGGWALLTLAMLLMGLSVGRAMLALLIIGLPLTFLVAHVRLVARIMGSNETGYRKFLALYNPPFAWGVSYRRSDELGGLGSVLLATFGVAVVSLPLIMVIVPRETLTPSRQARAAALDPAAPAGEPGLPATAPRLMPPGGPPPLAGPPGFVPPAPPRPPIPPGAEVRVEHGPTRVQASTSRPAAGGDPVAAALADLASGNPALANRALMVLAETPPDGRADQVTEALARVLAAGDFGQARGAVRGLLAWKTDKTRQVLEQASSGPQHAVRWEAIEALGLLGDPAAAPAIVAHLGEDAVKAVPALVALGPAAELAVLAALDHPEPKARREACRVLEQIGTKQTLDAMDVKQPDSDPGVRAAAQRTYRAIQGRVGSG